MAADLRSLLSARETRTEPWRQTVGRTLRSGGSSRSHAGLRSFVRDSNACLPSLLEKVLEVVLGGREADKEAMVQEVLGARSLVLAPLHALANQVGELA